jgi:hypothetical protein
MGPRGLLASSAFAFILLAALAPAALEAQAAAVRVDALVGFNGTAREGRLTPVILTIENPGGRLRAQVSLTVTWGTFRDVPPGWTITREAVLDAGATRRFSFVIPFPRDVRTLQAVVTSQGALVGTYELDLRQLSTTSRIIAGITSDLSLDSLAAIGGSTGSVRVVYPRVDDLPQAWAGYDGVDAVIVHDTYFQQLRSDQVEALEKWVVTGGVLVFTGGAAALQHGPAGFGRLLPVEVTGLTQRNGVPVAVGGNAVRRIPGRVEAAESTVTQGTVVAADGSFPVMVRRRLGRGSIWFLAFDPTASPGSSWDGALAMWRNILGADRVPAMGAASRPAATDSAVEDPWVAGLLQASPVSFPPVPALLAFIGAYVALLVPLLIGRTRRRMRARVRLLLLAGVSAFACLAGWAVFNRLLFLPGLQTMEAARIETRSGDGLAFVTEKVAYFAASAGQAEARLGSAGAVIEAPGWRAHPDLPLSQPHLLLDQAGQGTVVRGLDLQRLAARLVVFQDVIPFAVSVRVKADGSSVDAEVSNGNGRPLQECYILVSGRAYPLGDIAAGASVRRTFAASDAATFAGSDSRRAALFSKMEESGDKRSGPARLVGWQDGPALAVSFTGAQPVGGRPGLALVSVEAE